MVIKRFFLLFVFFTVVITAKAIPHNDPTKASEKPKEVDTIAIVDDDPFIEMLDSLIYMVSYKLHKPFFDESECNQYAFLDEDIPEYCDSVVELRIHYLNDISPFDYVYNDDVKKYIALYSIKRRKTVSMMLGLARLYFPIFEEMLDKYNLPVELKYLAIIESALNPVAVSRAGATGLWQFMPATGKMYGLDISRDVDKRRDPFLATEAACRHFIDLYNRFGDWTLVLAAYNAGSGSIGRAIRRAPGNDNDYWSIRPFMPRETQNYVPLFIAASYIMTYHTEYNLFPVHPKFNFFELDTVHITSAMSLKHLAEKLSLSYEDLQFLNPALKNDIIHGSPDEPWHLILPQSAVGNFLINQKAIWQSYSMDISQAPVASSTAYHHVRKGESLGIIAGKHGCKISDIKQWNNLRSNLIHPGQKLMINK